MFAGSTRVGNWAEDLALREARLQELRAKRDAGQLGAVRRAAVMAAAAAPMPLATTRDGSVRFGDSIQLRHDGGAVLAVVASDFAVLPAGVELAGVPAAAVAAWGAPAVARAVFRVVPADAADAAVFAPGAQLCYGDRFALESVLDPALLAPGAAAAPPLRLYSEAKMLTVDGSRLTGEQAALAATRDVGALAAWRCVALDPDLQLELEGTPVPANTNVLLAHCHTNQHLALLPGALRNDYGVEHEVACQTHHKKKKGALADNNYWALEALRL
jgi:hypothetical protein